MTTRLLLATATGVLYPLCFPNFDFAVLAWIVLVPLHLAIAGLRPRRAFWVGWLGGGVAFTGTMSWVVTAMHVYGKMPLPPSYAALLLLAAYLGLYVAVYAAVVAWSHFRRPALAWVLAPTIWVSLELLRTYLFSGLPWALLGYSQYQWLPVIQIADMTGVYGVSALLVLVNVALSEVALWWMDRRRSHAVAASPWPAVAAAMGLMLVSVIYGEMRVAAAAQSPAPVARVGLVQPNIDQGRKWDRAFLEETMARYARLTDEAAHGGELIIWPEAAMPFLFEDEPVYRSEIAMLAARGHTPILLGSPALRHYENGRPYLMNSAYLFSSDGRILGRYDKQHLVPFGEYIPLKSVLFFLDKLVEGIGDFEAGTVPSLLSLPPKADQASAASPPRFGVVICFEVIFPDLVRRFARDGADFLVTITNDAWFGDSAAPYQHFGMVVFRAVENHLAFARSANTGISGLIDPVGRILVSTPVFTEQAVTGAVPAGTGPTFYSQYGDVFAYACVIIAGLLLAACATVKKQE
jgi:apolipoprotein N-acyltransferase